MAPGLRERLRRQVEPRLRVFPDLAALSAGLAEALVEAGRRAVAARGRFLLVLNGGGTPEPLFSLLGERPFSGEPFWERAHVFWGDERCVPPDREGSNFKQAWESFLFHLHLPAGQVHRIQGELEPEEAALAYAAELALLGGAGIPWPRFDLVLLGMGADGHTASLFPGADYAGVEAAAAPVAADYEGRPAQRVTLTPAAFNSARRLHFMAVGTGKAPVLRRVLMGPHDPVLLPAQWIDPPKGEVTWWLDEAITHDLG